jgi:hypothetical protein
MPPLLPSRQLHLEAERVERFLRGELAGAEARAVVRHLLTRCPRCVAIAAIAAEAAGRTWHPGAMGRRTGGRHD